MPISHRYRNYRNKAKEEFREKIADLLENEQVKALDLHLQHYKYTRLRHSMDVAYLSYFITRLLGWDSNSAVRAGLLHDLFFHKEGQNALSLVRSHPREALENARKICELNEIEEDIILKHMWLLTLKPPKYKEGFVVTFVDKYCATREFIASCFSREEKKATLAPQA